VQQTFASADSTTLRTAEADVDVSVVRYAYIITGTLFVIPSTLFLVAFFRTLCQSQTPGQPWSPSPQQQQPYCYSVEIKGVPETTIVEKTNDVKQLNTYPSDLEDRKQRSRRRYWLVLPVLNFFYNNFRKSSQGCTHQ
jgi:hypothetical protein